MFRPKILLLLIVLILSFAWLSSSGYLRKIKATTKGTKPTALAVSHDLEEKTQLKASEAKIFVEKNNYNETVCFLIDMNMPSGQKRFFIYDLKKDSIQNSGLVTHGNCNQYWMDGRKYDNTVGCGCTSLGKYKIGNPYNGKFGLAFKLFGLEKTNSNAFARYVVLHSHSCVPENEIQDDICQSNGCPTVAPGFLLQLKAIINASKKPVLLWIYD